jgi:hypothetical protein
MKNLDNLTCINYVPNPIAINLMLVSHVDPVINNTSSDCTYNRPNRIAMIVPNDKT